MPDLGKYAGDVLLAYGFGLTLIAGIVALSIWQSWRAKQKLEQAERK
ncbi:MAG: heme exporter protein CcmD [Pseudomonadota bacterium]